MSETDCVILFIMCIVVILILRYISKNDSAEKKSEEKPEFSDKYVSKPILTDREYKFYKKLKPLAEEYGLQILMKIRLADLVEPVDKDNNPDWTACFNKIKSKHIDFALINSDTEIIALIELDDSTHDMPERVERDKFVNAVLENTGYTLIRTYGEISGVEKYLSEG